MSVKPIFHQRSEGPKGYKEETLRGPPNIGEKKYGTREPMSQPEIDCAAIFQIYSLTIYDGLELNQAVHSCAWPKLDVYV